MQIIQKALTSRTFYTLVFLFIFNGWNAIAGEVNPQAAIVVNGLLSLVATYFKLNPSQPYGSK